jgi:hypothetical protein
MLFKEMFSREMLFKRSVNQGICYLKEITGGKVNQGKFLREILIKRNLVQGKCD